MSEEQAKHLIQEARALNASARHNKRAADRHRKAAQAARAKQAEIERQCAALGITVTYEAAVAPERRFPGTPAKSTNPQAKENIHGQRTAARPLHSH